MTTPGDAAEARHRDRDWHPGAAQYFQQIFLPDWDQLAQQNARSD